MKILHYLFGLPPVRTGGVPQYVLDLAQGQKSVGCEVNILIPGPISMKNRDNVSIKQWKAQDGISFYRIFNPQYIPNGYGIRQPEQFMRNCSTEIYKTWLESLKPDILHIHSLLGLHLELLKAAKILKIPVIYTTHDYFGLCPKIDLLKDGIVCQEKNWTKCQACCTSAYELKRLTFEQSEIYRIYCGNNLLMSLVHCSDASRVKRFVSGLLHSKEASFVVSNDEKQASRQYLELEAYYQKCLYLVDWYHFNSRQTLSIFMEKMDSIKGNVIPVSNRGIQDNRKSRAYKQTLRLGYLGNNMRFKGYDFLLAELKELYQSGRTDFYVNTYMLEEIELPFTRRHKPYTREQLSMIFDEMDVLVVPSIWKETFGMVVAEALSYGVPVLVSENVGAKMLVEDYAGVGRIFSLQKHELAKFLIDIYDNRALLSKMNDCILESNINFEYSKHVQDVLDMYTHAIRDREMRK